jgi:hypothetical protein
MHLDGRAPATSSNKGGSCALPYLVAQPSAASAATSVTLPRFVLPTGTSEVRLVSTDAAGNTFGSTAPLRRFGHDASPSYRFQDPRFPRARSSSRHPLPACEPPGPTLHANADRSSRFRPRPHRRDHDRLERSLHLEGAPRPVARDPLHGRILLRDAPVARQSGSGSRRTAPPQRADRALQRPVPVQAHPCADTYLLACRPAFGPELPARRCDLEGSARARGAVTRRLRMPPE